MMKGKLIVIEGGDTSGKATQTEELKKRLISDGVLVETLDFPQYERPVGALIGELLKDKDDVFLQSDARVISTLFAADRYDSKSKIMEWLEAGKVVILDRYTSANMLHQGSKIADETERMKTIKWIYHLEHEIFGLPIPNVVFYLAMPARVRAQLLTGEGKEADMAEQNLQHQEEVDERAPSIMGLYETMCQVDCMSGESLQSVEDIHEEIYQKVRVILGAQ